jgi:hypothetical protein
MRQKPSKDTKSGLNILEEYAGKKERKILPLLIKEQRLDLPLRDELNKYRIYQERTQRGGGRLRASQTFQNQN